MARIYLVYQTSDLTIAKSLAKELTALDHTIATDHVLIECGSKWNEMILANLQKVDGVVFVIPNHAIDSKKFTNEMNFVRSYGELVEDKFLIPISFGDDTDLYGDVPGYRTLIVPDNDPKEAALEISRIITTHEARILANKTKQEKLIEKIETNAAQYVEVALQKLTERENSNKFNGTTWYIIGFICLAVGLILAVLSFSSLTNSDSFIEGIDVTLLIVIVVKAIIIVGLLIACSKYAFTLGKTYLNESLKNADRSHAISFGKFYLDAYGSTAKWEDLKEAFQYWNINNESSFSKLDPHQYDPKFVDQMISIYKMVRSDSK